MIFASQLSCLALPGCVRILKYMRATMMAAADHEQQR